ncbi:unnamed protein product [Closterium sp. Naga37s-1]|nr:unnamed protein product [Closterium sp. Naga37s-1]
MGAFRPRFLLALVLVASLNFLAVLAALPPDSNYDASEFAGLEEAYDARALLEANSEAAVDSVDWVESDNSEDPRILADVAADFKQPSESDGASGSAKKSQLNGQAGTNARAPVDSAVSPNGKSSAAAPKKGKQGTKRHCVRRRWGRCVKWAATRKHHIRTTKKTSGDLETADKASAKPKGAESGVPAVGKKGAAPVSTFESTQKKGAGAVSTLGTHSNSGAAPQKRALLGADSDDSNEWIDSVDSEDPRILLGAGSDASLESVDSVDSVDFEDPRVLRTMADVAADLKWSSDDFSGAVKNSLGQAGRNVRNSFDKTFRTGKFAPKKKQQRGRRPGKKPRKGNPGSGPKELGLDLKASMGLGFKIRAPEKKLVKGNPGSVPKPPVPVAGMPGVPTKLEGAKVNSGAASQPRVLTEDGEEVKKSVDFIESVDSIDSFDSVHFENPRVLRTVADAAADLKRSSDDFSSSVKNSLGQAGRNVRKSILKIPGKFVGVRPVLKPVTKPGVRPFGKPVTSGWPGVLPGSKPLTKPGVQPFTKPLTKPRLA